jgi:hypothetical protein
MQIHDLYKESIGVFERGMELQEISAKETKS